MSTDTIQLNSTQVSSNVELNSVQFSSVGSFRHDGFAVTCDGATAHNYSFSRNPVEGSPTNQREVGRVTPSFVNV